MPDARIEELAAGECHRLVAEHHLGRLAMVDDRGPVVFPVNYVVDRDMPVFRTDPGTKLDAADEATRTGWSVVIRGTLTEVRVPGDLERLRALPLYPWAPGERARYLRVRPVTVTGRRIHIPAKLPFTWWG